MKKHNLPISGDECGLECSRCTSTDTVWEEYGSSESDNSELGIHCLKCEYHEQPDDVNHRIEDNVFNL